jgi:hypothetical protein
MKRNHWMGVAVMVAAILGMSGSTARAEDKKDTAQGAASAATTQDLGPSEDEDTPQFLATMTITGDVRFGVTKHRECGPLSFKAAARSTVFTEQPTRQATSVATADFVKDWNDWYGSVTPNAQLELFSRTGDFQHAVVYLKSAPTWDEKSKTVTFSTACLIHINDETQKPKPARMFDHGALFIDSAKIGAWNSCYPKDDNGDGDGVCMEQWGSYPASCQRAGGVGHTSTARGKRCKQVCNVTSCPKGCFSTYRAGTSVSNLASAYECKM